MDTLVIYEEPATFCTECNHPRNFHKTGMDAVICTICSNELVRLFYTNCNYGQFVLLEELI